MARRSSKKGSGAGTMLLRIVFFSVLCAGAWYGWNIYRGKKPELPNWADLKPSFSNTNNPGTSTPPAAATPSRPAEKPAPDPIPTSVIPVVTNVATQPTNTPPPETEHEPRQVRNVQNTLDAQIALARKGISVGPIDGVAGQNMRRALLSFQIHNALSVSGELDADTRAALLVEEPLFVHYKVSEADISRLMRVPAGWLQKSEADRLDYESILELVAELGRASETFIRKLNPQLNWTNITPGTLVKIPRIDPPPAPRAAFARVHLYSKTLNVFGRETNLLAHFPCSIAAKVEKRPIGQLHVAKAALNPTYHFDPAVFSESAEARKIGRKLTIPAGPNNPVGTAWIGLSRPGYGIHGTPKPEQVGRTESHGCFRLANWNAEHLLQMAWSGMPVYIEP